MYDRLGFLRTKRLNNYYLNRNDAFRYLLYFSPDVAERKLGSAVADGREAEGTDALAEEDASREMYA